MIFSAGNTILLSDRVSDFIKEKLPEWVYPSWQILSLGWDAQNNPLITLDQNNIVNAINTIIDAWDVYKLSSDYQDSHDKDVKNAINNMVNELKFTTK